MKRNIKFFRKTDACNIFWSTVLYFFQSIVMNHDLWIIYYDWTSNIFSITILIECIRLLYLFQYDGALIRFFLAIFVLRLLKQAALRISCWASTSNRGSWDLTHAREKKKNKETLEEYKLIEKRLIRDF